MEAVLNEQQRLMREAALRLCGECGGPKRLRALKSGGHERDERAWAEVVHAGWLATAVPESTGGLGLGWFDFSLVIEEAAKQLLMVPLVQCGAAAWALSQAAESEFRNAALGDLIERGRIVLPTVPWEGFRQIEETPWPSASGDRRRPCITGKVPHVPFGGSAGAYLVPAVYPDGDRLLAVVSRNSRGLSVKTVANVDGSTASELTLDEVVLAAGQVVAASASAQKIVSGLFHLLALGTGMELLGAADTALAMTIDYLKLRTQFGRPIGSFQALQHRAANCFVDIELNRSLLYRLFQDWDRGQLSAAMVSAAKARVSRCALEVTRTALQLHGAIGYSDEHDIGLYFKRAVALAALYGSEIDHVSRFSRLTVTED